MHRRNPAARSGGEQALQERALRLKDSVRPGDTAARLAGDEFVIILEPLKRPGDAALYRVKEAGRGRWLVEA